MEGRPTIVSLPTRTPHGCSTLIHRKTQEASGHSGHPGFLPDLEGFSQGLGDRLPGKEDQPLNHQHPIATACSPRTL